MDLLTRLKALPILLHCLPHINLPEVWWSNNKLALSLSLSLLLLLLLLSHFSRVQLCATPEIAAYQAPLSLGFSRQEHWSGLPFPSPMHESEKWKWSHSVISNSSWPHGLQPTRLLHPWDSPGKSTGVGYHCLLHLSVSLCLCLSLCLSLSLSLSLSIYIYIYMYIWPFYGHLIFEANWKGYVSITTFIKVPWLLSFLFLNQEYIFKNSKKMWSVQFTWNVSEKASGNFEGKDHFCSLI